METSDTSTSTKNILKFIDRIVTENNDLTTKCESLTKQNNTASDIVKELARELEKIWMKHQCFSMDMIAYSKATTQLMIANLGRQTQTDRDMFSHFMRLLSQSGLHAQAMLVLKTKLTTSSSYVDDQSRSSGTNFPPLQQVDPTSQSPVPGQSSKDERSGDASCPKCGIFHTDDACGVVNAELIATPMLEPTAEPIAHHVTVPIATPMTAQPTAEPIAEAIIDGNRDATAQSKYGIFPHAKRDLKRKHDRRSIHDHLTDHDYRKRGNHDDSSSFKRKTKTAFQSPADNTQTPALLRVRIPQLRGFPHPPEQLTVPRQPYTSKPRGCPLCLSAIDHTSPHDCRYRWPAIIKLKQKNRWGHYKRRTDRKRGEPWCQICHGWHSFLECAKFEELSTIAQKLAEDDEAMKKARATE